MKEGACWIGVQCFPGEPERELIRQVFKTFELTFRIGGEGSFGEPFTHSFQAFACRVPSAERVGSCWH